MKIEQKMSERGVIYQMLESSFTFWKISWYHITNSNNPCQVNRNLQINSLTEGNLLHGPQTSICLQFSPQTRNTYFHNLESGIFYFIFIYFFFSSFFFISFQRDGFTFDLTKILVKWKPYWRKWKLEEARI